MSEGLLGGVLGNEEEKPETEAPEALAGAPHDRKYSCKAIQSAQLTWFALALAPAYRSGPESSRHGRRSIRRRSGRR